MIVLVILLVCCVVALFLGLWQDYKRLNDLENDLQQIYRRQLTEVYDKIDTEIFDRKDDGNLFDVFTPELVNDNTDFLFIDDVE